MMNNASNLAQTMRTLRSMQLPYPLMDNVRAISNGEIKTEEDLLGFLTQHEMARQHFASALSAWDEMESAKLDSLRRTEDRRQEIYECLGIDQSTWDEFNRAFPQYLLPGALQSRIVAAHWAPWFESRKLSDNFYWSAYQSVLEDRKGWNPESVTKLDASAAQVVERLANPTDDKRYQAKGLVVGYVQSGKTAHFTAVIAKAIDAGYRLVVVLAGMHNMLRSQTQRRLDMELVGVQNIQQGANLSDPRGKSMVDYANFDDSDWLAGNFLNLPEDPWEFPDIPRIVRLSHYQRDYRSLVTGLDALETQRHNPQLPLYHAENLQRANVRLLVVKKNSSVLRNFIDDMKALRANVDDLPALIIDDEADQASINTARPDPKGKAERTKINGAITEILQLLPRAQYVAYTATPFANVFVDADDAEDLFPRDFIFSLEAPPNYMGGKDFHDFPGDIPELRPNPEHQMKNEEAHVRDIKSDSDESLEGDSVNALDAFVLSGAIKLWRADNDPRKPQFRHHTMLVHESVKQAEHLAAAERFRRIWRGNGHDTADGLERLRLMFETDFARTSADRASPFISPERFDELMPYVSKARGKIIEGTQNDPVVIVNGSKDSDYDPLVFDTQDFWRILVGGAKLSRGFTVEGLTISFYRRRSMQEDTLLQMGRWFGYRAGYKDLVRLFIDRGTAGDDRSGNLYEAFKAIVQDEALFRAQLAQYSRLGADGLPEVQPRDVPPIVELSAPWLKPTSRNKMFNSKIARIGQGGMIVHMLSVARPEQRPGCHQHNWRLLKPWLTTKSWDKCMLGPRENLSTQVTTVEATEFVEVLEGFQWVVPEFAEARIGYLKDEIDSGELKDFAVIINQAAETTVALDGVNVPVGTFHRRSGRSDFTAPSENIRFAAEAITGNISRDLGPADRELRGQGRGAIILSFGTEAGWDSARKSPPQADEIVPLISFATPYKEEGQHRIAFVNRVEGRGNEPVVPLEGEAG